MAERETKADKKNITYISDQQVIVYEKSANDIKIGFELVRRKDSITKKESLLINAFIIPSTAESEKSEVIDFDKVEEMGSITASIINLQEDLLWLREYGIVLPRFVYGQLKTEIEKIYMSLKIEAVNEYSGVLTLLKDHIAEQPLVKGKHPYAYKDKAGDYYCIPVKVFSDLLNDSAFALDDATMIRRYLNEAGYTFCNKGRYDRTINRGTKPEKVICIFKEKIDAVMEEM